MANYDSGNKHLNKDFSQGGGLFPNIYQFLIYLYYQFTV